MIINSVECLADGNRSFSDKLRERLEEAGDNKGELLAAYDRLGEEYWEGFEYLVVNMPEHDLWSLKADLLF